jgi:hypothetical protein
MGSEPQIGSESDRLWNQIGRIRSEKTKLHCGMLRGQNWLKILVIGYSAKILDRRPCTGRSQEAVIIFLFCLEALFTRDSRVLLCAVSSSLKLKAAIGDFSDQTHFLLAPTAIRPVSNPLLSSCGPWENTVLLKCRHPHCMHRLFI